MFWKQCEGSHRKVKVVMEHDEKFSFVVKFENEGLLSQGVLEVVLFRAAPFSQVATAHMLF